MLPNFLVIGAPRCGTTSLYYYLMQHPDIFMSKVKEPGFFIHEGRDLGRIRFLRTAHRNQVSTIEEYRALFQNAQGKKAVGEASSIYLSSPQAPSRIKYYIPDVRLIAILRNPIEASYSRYLFRHFAGEELRPFNEVIHEEVLLLNNKIFNGHYIGAYMYASQLDRYFKIVKKEDLKIILFDDFISDPLNTVREVFSFLRVDPDFAPDVSVKYNELHAGLCASNIGRTACQEIKRVMPNKFISFMSILKHKYFHKKISKPSLDSLYRNELSVIFKNDILQLQALIDRDLGHWLL